MLKKTPVAILAFLSFSIASFAAPVSVPPSAGGDGIQAALDKLPAGGEIVLSPGKYVVSKPIIMQQDGQTLRGCGSSTILSLADNANCPVVILGSLRAPHAQPVKNIRLADLMIDGNRTRQPKEVWRILPDGAGVYNNGVDVWGPTDATVENVECAHCRSGGMVTSAGTRRLTVRNFTAYDSQFDGLACYDTEDSHFSHLNLHDNLAAAISLDLDFAHNVIKDAVLTADDLGIFMRQSRDNVFEDVTIKKSRHHGIFMAGTDVQTPKGLQVLPNSLCTGNSFNTLNISNSGGKAFLVNDRGCDHNTITGGQFSNNSQGGLVQVVANMVTMEPVGPQAAAAAAAKNSAPSSRVADQGPVTTAHSAL